MTSFESRFEYCGVTSFPSFTGTRVMMMPFLLGIPESLPDFLSAWREPVTSICSFRPQHAGQVGYLTIDEKVLAEGETHRRAGLHVDGVYRKGNGSWGGGGWGSVGTGMLTVSSIPACRAFNQHFDGWPGEEGDCEHMRDQLTDGTLLASGEVFWLDGLCVHESLRMKSRMTERQFVRVSLPSNAPWFEGYTVNPSGVLPTGPILLRREFMSH